MYSMISSMVLQKGDHVEDLGRQLVTGKQVDLILPDFSKACDKVSILNSCSNCHSMELKEILWIGLELSW